jgi:aryl-phospho-beta-D-glucosidase BglC (GH1 family)
MDDQHTFLSTKEHEIVDRAGRVVVLRGVGLGGWMNMENFVTGFPANEESLRWTLHRSLGAERYEFLFDRYLEYFFTEEDARFIRSLGLNLVRIPVNYRHFEDDMRPFEIKESGFKHLDRVVELCARHGIYTIIDLHAAPGCQNQDWHADNPTHRALFWQHKHFQDRVVNLWEVFAGRYKDNPWVAGYNPLNEPADPSAAMIEPFYRRVYQAIHAIDPEHIIFLEGNRYAKDFHCLGEPLPNVVYTLHDYAVPGFIDGGPYPGISRGVYVDKEILRRNFLETCQYMLDNRVPIWVGEFGPVYTGKPDLDSMRFRLLEDQLDIYAAYQASWALWTYKDIGLQGVVHTAPGCKWTERIRPVLEKKRLLGVDSWGGLDEHIRHIMGPLEETFAAHFPAYNPFPFGAQWQINRVVRHVLLAEPLLEEFGALVRDLTETDIDELMHSFHFRNCVPRMELCEILSNLGVDIIPG